MNAIDSNIFLRLMLRGDDDKVTAAGLALIEVGGAFIPTTVVLESYWFMRRKLRVAKKEISDMFYAALGTDGLFFQEPDLVFEATESMNFGLEFDDALHALSSPSGCRFATFDADLVKGAQKAKLRVDVFTP